MLQEQSPGMEERSWDELGRCHPNLKCVHKCIKRRASEASRPAEVLWDNRHRRHREGGKHHLCFQAKFAALTSLTISDSRHRGASGAIFGRCREVMVIIFWGESGSHVLALYAVGDRERSKGEAMMHDRSPHARSLRPVWTLHVKRWMTKQV